MRQLADSSDNRIPADTQGCNQILRYVVRVIGLCAWVEILEASILYMILGRRIYRRSKKCGLEPSRLSTGLCRVCIGFAPSNAAGPLAGDNSTPVDWVERCPQPHGTDRVGSNYPDPTREESPGYYFIKNISRTSAVSSTDFRSILIFVSCAVGTYNILYA